jgi:hypothetical protein
VRMKDGTTHLSYKAEHVVELDTELILAAEIYHANQPDSQTLEDSVNAAQTRVRKRYLISAAAHNLSVLMRVLFQMGTPRGLQQFVNDLAGVVSSLYFACLIMAGLKVDPRRITTAYRPYFQILPTTAPRAAEPAGDGEFACISTGC